MCLEDVAQGSRVSVFVPCRGGMVEAGTGSAIPPQRWAVAISPIHARLSEPQYRQSADHQAVHALNKALEWAELSFVRMTRVRPLSANHGHRGDGLGNTTFRFLCSLTSRSALRLYAASRSNSKDSTRSSGGSILAVAKSSLSCSMSVLSFSVTASLCPSEKLQGRIGLRIV